MRGDSYLISLRQAISRYFKINAMLSIPFWQAEKKLEAIIKEYGFADLDEFTYFMRNEDKERKRKYRYIKYKPETRHKLTYLVDKYGARELSNLWDIQAVTIMEHVYMKDKPTISSYLKKKIEELYEEEE